MESEISNIKGYPTKLSKSSTKYEIGISIKKVINTKAKVIPKVFLVKKTSLLDL